MIFKESIFVERDGRIFQLHWKNRFDPVTVAIVAGAALGAAGQIQAGKAAERQGKAEQEILDFNAKIKEREAAAELERSEAAARKFGEEGEALKGKQRVAIARGGVLASEGTPAFLLEETAFNLEADRLEILKEGFLSKSFRLSEAENLRASGRAAKVRGKAAKSASRFQATGTLLTGLGTAAIAAEE